MIMARPTPNNPTGAQKPLKKTPETLTKLEEAFAIDASVAEACFFAGISQKTYYEWIKNDPKLGERFAELRQNPVLKARNVVMEALNNKDKDTAKWYLERKAKNEFAPRNELTGAGGGPIQMSAEEIEEVKKMFPDSTNNV